MWRKRSSLGTGLRLLKDELPSHQGDPDLFDQATVTQSIARIVENEIVSAEPKDFIIGFFGRYGQGKSKVVDEIVKVFDKQEITTSNRIIYSHCEIFPVSNYKPQDLEENFDFFLEGRRVASIATITLILLGAVFFLTLQIIDVLNIENRVQLTILITVVGALLAGLGSLIGGFRLSWRDFSRSLRLGELRNFFENRLRANWRGPKLLIVDDLDRATPEQQSALLQSLRRHRGSLGSVVLVAFNDERLKEDSDLGNDFAEEVFQKTFDVQVRLGPMTASDAAEMSFYFLSRLTQMNPPTDDRAEANTVRMLMSPLVMGDIARVLYLHGNASARFAKKMLNSICVEAVRLSLTSVHDLSALIRIHGLMSYFSTLESDLDFFSVALNEQSTNSLISSIEGRLGGDLTEEKRGTIRRYLLHTNHMRPSHGTWKRVLRIWRDLRDSEDDDEVHADIFPPEIAKNWAMADALLVATDSPVERNEIYKDLLKNPLARPRDRQLPRTPEFPTEADETPTSDTYIQLWKYLVLRVEVYDENLTEIFPHQDFLKKIQKYEDLEFHSLPPIAAKVGGSLWTSPAGIVEHHSKMKSKDIRLEDSLRQSLAVVDFTTPELRKLRPIGRNLQSLTMPLIRAWPIFGLEGETSGAAASSHFDRLREVLLMYRDSDGVLPNAHSIFLKSLQEECTENAFSYLSMLYSFDDNLEFWPFGTVLDALTDSDIAFGFRTELLQRAFDVDPKMVFWFSAVYFQATQKRDKELDDHIAIISKSKISLDSLQHNSRWLQDVRNAGRFSASCFDLTSLSDHRS